jgi:hypothetical protein
MRTFRFAGGSRRLALWLVLAGCLLSVSVVVAGAGPGPKDAEDFLGLWHGVDSLDGSPVRLSLSDIDGDGILELVQQEDFFTACFSLGPAYSRGRGVVTGTATVARKGVLDVASELICLSDSNVPVSLGTAPVQYTLRSKGRVLVLPPFGSAPAIVLHRVAQ